MSHHAPILIEYAQQWQDELVLMWRESFEFGVGVRDPHSLEEQTSYFNAEVLAKNTVRLAVAGTQLVGFVARHT